MVALCMCFSEYMYILHCYHPQQPCEHIQANTRKWLVFIQGAENRELLPKEVAMNSMGSRRKMKERLNVLKEKWSY